MIKYINTYVIQLTHISSITNFFLSMYTIGLFARSSCLYLTRFVCSLPHIWIGLISSRIGEFKGKYENRLQNHFHKESITTLVHHEITINDLHTKRFLYRGLINDYVTLSIGGQEFDSRLSANKEHVMTIPILHGIDEYTEQSNPFNILQSLL